MPATSATLRELNRYPRPWVIGDSETTDSAGAVVPAELVAQAVELGIQVADERAIPNWMIQIGQALDTSGVEYAITGMCLARDNTLWFAINETQFEVADRLFTPLPPEKWRLSKLKEGELHIFGQLHPGWHVRYGPIGIGYPNILILTTDLAAIGPAVLEFIFR